MTGYILRRSGKDKSTCIALAENSESGLKVRVNGRRSRPADIVFRWGCLTRVHEGVKVVVNRPDAMMRVANKARFRNLITDMPYCPKTYWEPAGIVYPVVVRPAHHAAGQHLYIVNNINELNAMIPKLPNGETWYATEIIKKDAEYRVFVASGRVAWVVKKIPGNPEEFAWNVEKGGKFENIRFKRWPLGVCKAAISACNLAELHFGAVDVIVAKKTPYVLEINTAPTITSPYRRDITAKVFDYMVKNGPDVIPLRETPGNYSKFAHPAILNLNAVTDESETIPPNAAVAGG